MLAQCHDHLKVFQRTIGILSIEDERDDDDELHHERTGSRTSFKAGKFDS